jgi:hypothetical protein
MQESNEILRLPIDMLKNITSYLASVQDKTRFVGSCWSLFNNREHFKKDIRETYIKAFLTDHPKLVQKYSEENAFNALYQNFIIPFKNVLFSIPKPIAIIPIARLNEVQLTEGEFSGQRINDVCFILGFEKLYLQLLRSDVAFRCSWNYKGNDKNELAREVNSAMSNELSLSLQLYIIINFKYPATLFMVMAKSIEPYSYFTALAATLISERIDLFDELLNYFEANKHYLTHQRCIQQKGNRLFIAHLTNKKQRGADLTLENVRDWSPQFKSEFDGIGFSDYFKNSPCKMLFDLCLAKRAEGDTSHPLHFLWACYAGDSNCIRSYFDSSTLLIREVTVIQESPLSLYAQNVHPEEACIIEILLNNLACSEMMHSRNAMQQTPIQIAIENKKFELVIAILAKTDDETLNKEYSPTERTAIDRARIGHLEGLSSIQQSEPELEPEADNNSCRIC